MDTGSRVMYGVETLSENNSTVLETPEIIIWVPFPLSIDNALLLPSPYQSGYQYHWLPANSVSNFATPPACGTLDYYVRAKNAACTVSSLYSLPKTFGVRACGPSERDNQNLIIYPNPTSGQLQLELEGIQEKNADERDTQIGIYDNLGKLQAEHQVNDTTLRQTTLDLTALPAGTYWVVWFANGEVVDTQQVQKID